MVPDLEELGGRDLHALQVGLRRHGGGAEGRGGARKGAAGRGGGAVRGADSVRGRRGDGGDGGSGSGGGDGSDGSSRRRPAEGYLWGRPGRATPPGAALPLRGARRGLPARRGGGPGSPAGGTAAGASPEAPFPRPRG